MRPIRFVKVAKINRQVICFFFFFQNMNVVFDKCGCVLLKKKKEREEEIIEIRIKCKCPETH